jgi:outer membrane protein assembly factor BamB
VKLIAALSTMLLLAACGNRYTTVEPPTELKRVKVSVDAHQLWRTIVGGEEEDDLLLPLAPASDGRRVYVAGRDGTVMAIDAENGDRVWETVVPRLTRGSDASLGLWNRALRPIESSSRLRLAAGPGLGAGILVVGSSDGEVAAITAEDGHLLWNVVLGSEIVSTPAVDGTTAVVRLANGQLVALDARDGGRTRWIADQPVPSLSIHGSARPVIVGDRVYTGFDNGKIAAYDLARGQLVWEVPLATPSGRSEIERLVDADGIFQVSADQLFAVAFHGRAAALALDDGHTLWQHDLSSSRGLSADLDAVYVTDADSQVWALDRQNGGPMWTQADLRARNITAPVLVGDAIAVADFEGYVHLLDRATGRIVGRAHSGPSPIVAPPLAIGDMLVVQDVRGRVTAWRIGKRG